MSSFFCTSGRSQTFSSEHLNIFMLSHLVLVFMLHVPLDMPRQLLYWFDEGMRRISRVNLDGRQRKTVVESNGYLDRAFGLSVFEVQELHYGLCCLTSCVRPGGQQQMHFNTEGSYMQGN